VDQVIQHPTFGLGLVTAIRGDKADITFKSEAKTLVHGRGGSTSERPAFQPPNARSAGPADKPLPPGTTETTPAAQLPPPPSED
jgi:hypothetical protein